MQRRQILRLGAVGGGVFALGVVLYECLTKEQPFAGPSIVELVSRITNGKFTRIRTKRSDVPPAFAAVTIILGATTLLASLIPAWRAASVDPLIALRTD